MERIVPFDSAYSYIRKLEKFAFLLLIISAIMTVAIWIENSFLRDEIQIKVKGIIGFFEVISYASMASYLIITLISKVLFHLVEKRKRNDLIDNSFGTNYSDDNTKGYYNNEDVPIGMLKLALNSYESSFHTESILKNMFFKKVLILIGFSIPFILSIFSEGGQSIIRVLLEISIPMVLLSHFIIMTVYYYHVVGINERFKVELTNIGRKQLEESDFPKLFIPVIEYHTIKAWANISLDSKVFKNCNRETSEKWNRIREILKM